MSDGDTFDHSWSQSPILTTLGRITPIFLSEVEELKRTFHKTLMDPDNREAFKLLIRAWCSEDTAIANAYIPYVLDNMNLMANVHNKKCIEELRKRIRLYVILLWWWRELSRFSISMSEQEDNCHKNYNYNNYDDRYKRGIACFYRQNNL